MLLRLLSGVGLSFLYAPFARAHEAYVIPSENFWSELSSPISLHSFDALKDPHNLTITLSVIAGVVVLLGANLWFRSTGAGQRFYAWLEGFAWDGPHVVRLTIALALFFSAASNSFLGPEVPLSVFPYPEFVRFVLFAMSALIALGFLTELAAIAGIVLFVWCATLVGPYLFSYVNYLGEFIVLLLFGMRVLSVDRYLFGPLRRFKAFERYETAIVRICYGFTLLYAAVTVKLLHPDITYTVVHDWNLTQFYWLFPSDPLLVTLGAGLVEAMIGIFIIIGFELRLTVLVSLFYITLSLLFFRELVWPHLLLYGISISLLVQPEIFTLDHLIFSRQRSMRSWWRRPFRSHTEEGKSSRA